jgi:hypothetical protein
MLVDSCEVMTCEFDVLDGSNCLQIIYHKTEQETVVENGEIVKDQCLQLDRIWVDDVLMEPWFITEGCYYPAYFPGIAQRFPDWPRQLPSQNIWHFPGYYAIHFDTPFWPWYGAQRRKFCKPLHADKDAERWENWSGSHRAHEDLVQEIYRLLDV